MPWEKNQIKPTLLLGNMQREKLSVSCRVCKRYHLLGWCSLPADGVPQGKWWWKTQTSCIHPSIILLISTSPRHKYSIRVQVEETQNFKDRGEIHKYMRPSDLILCKWWSQYNSQKLVVIIIKRRKKTCGPHLHSHFYRSENGYLQRNLQWNHQDGKCSVKPMSNHSRSLHYSPLSKSHCDMTWMPSVISPHSNNSPPFHTFFLYSSPKIFFQPLIGWKSQQQCLPCIKSYLRLPQFSTKEPGFWIQWQTAVVERFCLHLALVQLSL